MEALQQALQETKVQMIASCAVSDLVCKFYRTFVTTTVLAILKICELLLTW
jgi:hypothetical protein